MPTGSYSAVITDPTCTEEGYTTYTYKVEGQEDAYTIKVNIVEETGHDLDYVEANAASCTEAGTVAHYECLVCKKYFEDAGGTTEITDLTGETATGHSYTNYVSDNNATATEDGTRTATCDNGCGTTDTITDEGSATGKSGLSAGAIAGIVIGSTLGALILAYAVCAILFKKGIAKGKFLEKIYPFIK